ncbi:MAG: MBL fold metallo-hydrolase [Acidilobaceae archaeon]
MPRRVLVGAIAVEREGLAGVRIREVSSSAELCIDVLDPQGCTYKLYTHTHENHYPSNPPGDAFSPAGPRRVAPGDSMSLPPFFVRAVHAYNREDLERAPRHRRGEGVGYIVYHGDYSIYHVGDSDLIPEMASLRSLEIDVMLVPVGGGSVMEPEEALEAVKTVRPSVAVPIHYWNLRDAERFKLLSHPYSQVILLASRSSP